MARGKTPSDPAELEKLEWPYGWPPPWRNDRLVGHELAERTMLAAQQSGRLHHAWLLTGPRGIGKATLAWRFARFLLAGQDQGGLFGGGPESLGVPVDAPGRHLIDARSHPDLFHLRRALNHDTGRIRAEIAVDDVRGLGDFMHMTPAMGKWRVAIVDSADEMNRNSANAVLKILEEPPPNAVLLIVSHAPGRLLPTIRSRCRTLSIPAMDQAVLAERLQHRLGLGPKEAQRLAAMSRGALGRALRLAQSGALAADDAARGLLTGLPKLDEAALLSLADSFRGGDGAARFALVFERLADQIHEMAAADSLAGRAAGLDRWSQVWTDINRLAADTEALNLDRTDALWSAVAQLRAAAA